MNLFRRNLLDGVADEAARAGQRDPLQLPRPAVEQPAGQPGDGGQVPARPPTTLLTLLLSQPLPPPLP